METPDAYSEMLGIANASPQPSAQPAGSFSGTVTPAAAPDPLALIRKPVATPQEIEQRKTGWAAVWDKLQNDPNLQAALSVAGAKMSQPVHRGESAFGNLTNAVVAGQGAFKAGELLQRQQKREDTTDAQKAAESAAEVAQRNAQTETSRAQLPGVQADVRVKTATVDDRIKKAKEEAEKATLDLSKAREEEDVAKVERTVKKRKAEIAQTIPDANIRSAMLAELDKPELELEATRARIQASKASAASSYASAAEHKAGATMKELTVKELEAMPPAERKQFLTKTGQYSATSSALSQHATLWGGLYEKLPADDPNRKGKTKEQFVMERLQSAKQKDAIELYLKAKQVGMDDADIDALGLKEMALESAATKKPGPREVKGKIKVPVLNEKRVINGKPAHWDGKGWLAD